MPCTLHLSSWLHSQRRWCRRRWRYSRQTSRLAIQFASIRVGVGAEGLCATVIILDRRYLALATNWNTEHWTCKLPCTLIFFLLSPPTREVTAPSVTEVSLLEKRLLHLLRWHLNTRDMSPPGLLLWGAIPVPPGQQREQQRQSQLPALLRGEGVLTRVLANLPTHANSPAPPRSTCRDVGKCQGDEIFKCGIFCVNVLIIAGVWWYASVTICCSYAPEPGKWYNNY